MNNTFQATAEEWLLNKSLSVKDSTLACYNGILNRYLIPAFGGTDIAEITLKDVQHFLTSHSCKNLAEPGSENLSGSTIACILTVLKSVMTYARNQKDICICELTSINIRHGRSQARSLDRHEQNVLTENLLDNSSNINIGILLCLYGGLRIGEICALKWEDISCDCKYINICRTMQRVQIPNAKKGERRTRIIIEQPKSVYSIRQIPIPDILANKLSEVRSADYTYVLTGTQKYIEPRTMENHIYRSLKKCGINNASAHTLRHSYATRSIEMGTDMKTVSELMGHSSVKVTMDIYFHSSMELKLSNSQKLNKLLAIK